MTHKTLAKVISIVVLSISPGFAAHKIPSPHARPKAFEIPPHAIDTSHAPPDSSRDALYSERPDISTVTPHDHTAQLPKTWKSQREGHANALAEILEMYPHRHLYFLARDGELLYDYAKIILKGEPEQLKRIHLLNVSRANQFDRNIERYLAQEGISKSNLEKGMEVLFVDTGFSGTIPATLSSHFPGHESQLQTHLMSSSNLDHPSTRVFLEHFNSNTVNLDPSHLHGSILDYEHMHRYTFRSNRFDIREGRWVAASTPAFIEQEKRNPDGKVDASIAIKYMADVHADASSANGRAHFAKERDFWREVRHLLDTDQKDALRERLKAEVAIQDETQKHREARVRDFLELVERNEPTRANLLPTLAELGLKHIGASMMRGTKQQLIQDHPEWAPIFANPATEIPRLVNGNDQEVQTLRNIMDEIGDVEIKNIITQALLFGTDPTHHHKSVESFQALLEKPSWNSILEKFFNEKVHENGDFLEKALQCKTPELRRKAAEALGYYQGPDLYSLFTKAFTHSDEAVREEAAYTLLFRHPQDPQAMQMLVNLLKDPDPKFRRKIANLIHTLYPTFHRPDIPGKEGYGPLKTYLASDCDQPIHEVLDAHALKSVFEALSSSLEGATSFPTGRVERNDPRVPSDEFAKLGEMLQFGGVIWSGYAEDRYRNLIGMTNYDSFGSPDAAAYCRSIGGRLPTKRELQERARARGFGVPGKTFDSAAERKSIWSGTKGGTGEAAFVLFSDTGEVRWGFRGTPFNVVCVSGAPLW